MYGKMLVPLDGSGLAETALVHVEILLEKQVAKEAIFLRVIDTAAESLYNLEKSIKERIEKETREYLDNVADAFRKRGVNTQIVVLYGDIAETILQYTERNGVEIIVMSTHGRTGIFRFFAGSVAEKVMRYSAVPVLIVPPLGARRDK